MYKVLYRKYRPQYFADVVGQPQVTVTLKNELMRGRIAHAYLFTGSRGTGKTTCAKILARAVNCLHPKDGDPCGECEICRGLEDGSILDVVEIDAASNNGVDSIRSLIEESNFTPATAKYRVYIIDEVHMLSVAAFNALLKTLEEPPPHVIFILATTEVHKLLPTILSRCQRFDFKRIAPEDIAGRLEDVAQRENAQLDHDAALLIARVADGALRDALSLLDQCLGRDRHVTLDIVNQTAGVAARDYLAALAQDIVHQDAAHALEAIDGLHRESKDMSRLCEEMAEYFRGLMLIKTMKDASRLVLCSPQELEVMTGQALALSLSTILHGLDTFEETLHKMRYANQRAELEMAFVKLCSPQLDTSPEALLRRLEALENGAPRQIAPPSAPAPAPTATAPTPVPAAAPPAAEPPRQEEAAPPPEPAAAQEPPQAVAEPEVFQKAPAAPPPQEPKPAPAPKGKKAAVDVEALSAGAQRFRDWPEILQRVRGDTKSVAMAFAGSAAYVNGDYMLIEAPELAFELLKRPEQRDRMREAIRQVTGRVYKLGPYRLPQEQTETALDPLAELERRARENGIALQEEGPSPTADSPEDDGPPPLTDAEIPF